MNAAAGMNLDQSAAAKRPQQSDGVCACTPTGGVHKNRAVNCAILCRAHLELTIPMHRGLIHPMEMNDALTHCIVELLIDSDRDWVAPNAP